MRVRRLIPVGLLAVVCAAVAWWVGATPEPALRLQLMRWQFWMLEAQFLLLAALTWVNVPRAIRAFRPGRPAIVAAAGISALMAALVIGVAPRTNRIYYDEHIYEGVAQNLADLHRAQVCNDGTVEYGSLQCSRAEYNKEPAGYPYLLSLGYRLVGVHESVAHYLNALCAVAVVWVVFVTACGLFGSTSGVLAALAITLIPQQLVWSHTAAAEPSAALASALAVLAAVYHVRDRSTTSLIWVAAAVAFAVQFRMESLLIAPVTALILAVYAPDEFLRPRFWWSALLVVTLCGLHAGHIAAIQGDSWGSAGPRLSLGYFWSNLQVNGLFYLDNVRFPVVLTALAAVGLLARPTKAVAVIGMVFLAFWGVFLVFYAGSYNFGADVRFSLLSYPALALLSGRGAAALHGTVARRTGVAPAWGMVIAALGVQFLWFVPQVRAVGEEAWAARADVRFAQRVIPTLPANAIVLTHNPSIFLLNGMSAAQMSFASSEPAYVARILSDRYAGGIFLHWNAWCGYTDRVQQAFCESTLRSFSSELVAEYRERDFRYAFYRLLTQGTIAKTAP